MEKKGKKWSTFAITSMVTNLNFISSNFRHVNSLKLELWLSNLIINRHYSTESIPRPKLVIHTPYIIIIIIIINIIIIIIIIIIIRCLPKLIMTPCSQEQKQSKINGNVHLMNLFSFPTIIFVLIVAPLMASKSKF